MLKKIMKRREATSADILARIFEVEKQIKSLPPLSPVEKAKLEHSLAIEQLYYSSKLEGTSLTEKMIENAIHGPELSPSKN